jgi:hypothetical protein
MNKAVWGAGIHLAAVVVLSLASVSCGTVAREGTASSFLIIKALEGASGAQPGTFGATVSSDVLTVVQKVPTIFSDPGRVQLALALKDPGAPASPASPSQANWITVNRYHVRFIRSDGRNTEGVDVPYAFDSTVTATVADDTTIGFTLVRLQAKEEAPLRALAVSGVIVSTIAEVTFYGHDQTGRAVSVTGNIGVSFGNFGDPS